MSQWTWVSTLDINCKNASHDRVQHISVKFPQETYNLHVNIGLDQTQPVKPTKHISFCSFCSVQVVPETFSILGGFHRYGQSISALGSSQSLDLQKNYPLANLIIKLVKKNPRPKFVTLSLPSQGIQDNWISHTFLCLK